MIQAWGHLIAAAALIAAVSVAGCAADPVGPSLRGGPRAKLRAIQAPDAAATIQGRRGLVEQLDSDDPVVRVTAVDVLRTWYGDDLGYDPLASPADRSAATDRWMAVLEREVAELEPRAMESLE